MPKEFNIDDYQYTEERIGFSQWLQAYKPQPNLLNHDAKFSGLLFEHHGEEWDFIVKQPNQLQWTLYRDDEDGKLYIRNGLRVKGRVGYFYGHQMHNSHATIIVDGVSEANLEHQVCGTDH